MVGATCITFCAKTGMLSRGVMPPEVVDGAAYLLPADLCRPLAAKLAAEKALKEADAEAAAHVDQKRAVGEGGRQEAVDETAYQKAQHRAQPSSGTDQQHVTHRPILAPPARDGPG